MNDELNDEIEIDIDSFKNAIKDAVESSKEDLMEATKLSHDSEHEAGRALGLYEVMDTLKNRLLSYGIDAIELGLDEGLDEIIMKTCK